MSTNTAVTPASHLPELEAACVNLLAQLEFQLAQTENVCRSEQVERSPDVASKMLARLLDFVETHLHGAEADQAREEIIKVSEVSELHKSVMASRSWGESLRSMLMKDDVDYNSLTTHTAIGKALARASASVFYSTIAELGQESKSGKELGQSTVTFVKQLEAQW